MPRTKWTPTGNPMGPPKTKVINIPPDGKLPEKVIDINQVIYWAKLQCTQEEVAGCFQIDTKTLNARLEETIGMTYSMLREKVQGEGKASLRRMQFRQAEKNSSMAIWLGKQWLGQKDKDDSNIAPHDKALAFADAYIKAEAENQELKKRLELLEKKLGVTEPETNTVIHPGDQEDEYMGGGCSLGQNLRQHSEADQPD